MISAAHDEYDGLAVGWALHALEPGDEHAFADHLATCSRCQRLVHESEEALGELAYEVPLLEPPPQLLDRIRHATGATDAMPARVGRSPRRRAPAPGHARRLRWAAPAMAAALVLVALLGWNIALRRQAQQEHQLAARRQAAVIGQLAGSTTRAALIDGGKRTVGYVQQRGSTMEVVSRSLLPNDPKTTYVLWAVQRTGGPALPVGTFDVVQAGLDVRTVRGPALPIAVTGFSISREPGRGVPARPTEIVATGVVRS